MNQLFVHPKFMWKPAFEPHLTTQRKVNVNADKLDLLGVSRVYSMTTIDRRRHPFALQSKCFALEFHDEEFVFQARTTKERDDLVFAFKLLIARLASLLLTRDFRAIEEFFEPVDSSVPGRAPDWTQARRRYILDIHDE